MTTEAQLRAVYFGTALGLGLPGLAGILLFLHLWLVRRPPSLLARLPRITFPMMVSLWVAALHIAVYPTFRRYPCLAIYVVDYGAIFAVGIPAFFIRTWVLFFKQSQANVRYQRYLEIHANRAASPRADPPSKSKSSISKSKSSMSESERKPMISSYGSTYLSHDSSFFFKYKFLVSPRAIEGMRFFFILLWVLDVVIILWTNPSKFNEPFAQPIQLCGISPFLFVLIGAAFLLVVGIILISCFVHAQFDAFGARVEMRLSAFITALAMVIFAALVATGLNQKPIQPTAILTAVGLFLVSGITSWHPAYFIWREEKKSASAAAFDHLETSGQSPLLSPRDMKKLHNAAIEFTYILIEPESSELFQQHCLSEFNVENFFFWKDCERIFNHARRGIDVRFRNKYEEDVIEIMNEYVLDSSPSLVNLSGKRRSALVKAFEAFKSQVLENEFVASIDEEKEVDESGVNAKFAYLLSQLKDAQHDIFTLMLTDTFKRFQATARYGMAKKHITAASLNAAAVSELSKFS